MSEQLYPDLNRQLDTLRNKYRADLRNHVAEISASWAERRRSPTLGTGLLALRNLVHRLAGTSGVFGLREVSRAAFALEKQLDLHEQDDVLSAAQVRTIDGLVEALNHLATACCRA